MMGRYATGVINVRHAWHATGRPPSPAQFETKSLPKIIGTLWQTQNFPRSFRVLAYRSLVLLRVPQHEAQMSAVHRGDGGTP